MFQLLRLTERFISSGSLQTAVDLLVSGAQGASTAGTSILAWFEHAISNLSKQGIRKEMKY